MLIVQLLYFLNPKFPASNHLLCLYSPICVGPGRNPNCWFSHAQAHFCVLDDYKIQEKTCNLNFGDKIAVSFKLYNISFVELSTK